jgi:hypothetical protein
MLSFILMVWGVFLLVITILLTVVIISSYRGCGL